MNPDIRAVDDNSCVGPKIFLSSFLETVDEFRCEIFSLEFGTRTGKECMKHVDLKLKAK